jgi:hypothetical protein
LKNGALRLEDDVEVPTPSQWTHWRFDAMTLTADDLDVDRTTRSFRVRSRYSIERCVTASIHGTTGSLFRPKFLVGGFLAEVRLYIVIPAVKITYHHFELQRKEKYLNTDGM